MSKLVTVAELQVGDRFEFVAIGDKFGGSAMSDHPNLMVVANMPKTNRVANSCFFRYKSEADPLEMRSWNGAAEIEVRLITDRVVSPSGVTGAGATGTGATPTVATAANPAASPSSAPAAAAPAKNGLAAAMAGLKSVFPDSPNEVKSLLKAEPIAATKVDMRPAAKPAPTIVDRDDEDDDESEEKSGKLALRIPVKGELHSAGEDEIEEESTDYEADDDAESAKPARKRTAAKSAKKESTKSAASKKKAAKSAEAESAAAKPAKKKAAKPSTKKKS
jgi:hypothetical protein